MENESIFFTCFCFGKSSKTMWGRELVQTKPVFWTSVSPQAKFRCFLQGGAAAQSPPDQESFSGFIVSCVFIRYPCCRLGHARPRNCGRPCGPHKGFSLGAVSKSGPKGQPGPYCPSQDKGAKLHPPPASRAPPLLRGNHRTHKDLKQPCGQEGIQRQRRPATPAACKS